MKWISLLFFILCNPLGVMADGGVVGVLKKIGAYIDKSTISGIDSNYISVPKEPWQVVLKSNVNQTTSYMDGHVDNEPGEAKYSLDWKPEVTTGVGLSAGIWVGYRGYGFGLQKSITQNDSYNFNVSACGSKYGLNFRIRHFDASKVKVELVAYTPEDPLEKKFYEDFDLELGSPINVRTMMLEGYYLFNGRHYSNTAVFDQSAQQVKSAGSFMAGFTWYKSSLKFDNQNSTEMIFLMNQMGRIKQWQFSLGGGYAYNWVPQRNWLFSIQAMPMLMLLNRIKKWNYDISYTIDEEGAEDETGEDFKEVVNLKSIEDTHSRIVPSGVARLGLVYNYKRFYATMSGQIYTYGFKSGQNSVRMVEWFLNTSLGFRF